MLLTVACVAPSPMVPAAPSQPPSAPAPIRRCSLPPVPDIPVAVGYPSPDSIFVTTTDLEALTRALVHMTTWLRAAAACLGSGS